MLLYICWSRGSCLIDFYIKIQQRCAACQFAKTIRVSGLPFYSTTLASSTSIRTTSSLLHGPYLALVVLVNWRRRMSYIVVGHQRCRGPNRSRRGSRLRIEPAPWSCGDDKFITPRLWPLSITVTTPSTHLTGPSTSSSLVMGDYTSTWMYAPQDMASTSTLPSFDAGKLDGDIYNQSGINPLSSVGELIPLNGVSTPPVLAP
jgi:hypothetical protein